MLKRTVLLLSRVRPSRRSLFFRVGRCLPTPTTAAFYLFIFFYPTKQTNACAHLVGWPRFLSLCGQILAMVDGLMVHQEVETLEAIANAIGIGYEGNNQ